MKAQGVLIVVWLTTAALTRIGVMIGAASGTAYTITLALVGAGLGAVGGVWIASRLRWLDAGETRLAAVGGVAGALLAIVLLVTLVGLAHERGPAWLAVLEILAGVGALIGAGRARGSLSAA